MKSTRFCAPLILSAMTLASLPLAAQNNTPTLSAPKSEVAVAGPVLEVDNTAYNFGKAPVGEKVRHTYMVTNTGNELLNITNVHPQCGCTTVGDWTHKIEPGQSGKIEVQFDTSRYGGVPSITKTIQVFSNAKNGGIKTLTLTGAVWKPIEVTPTVAVFSIAPDSDAEATQTVKIVNKTDNPIVVSNPVSANGLFTATVKEIVPGKEFDLLITSKPPYKPGNSPGTVTVTTSMPGMPTISVPVTASVPQPIQMFPAQLFLSAVSDRWITNRVTIHGNTTNVLVLSNPKASDSRIKVEIQPMGPKSMFSLLVEFPPGFQLETGKTAEVTVESNHPRVPLLTLPIREYLRPKRFSQISGRPFPTPVPVQNPAITNAAFTHQNPPPPAPPAHP